MNGLIEIQMAQKWLIDREFGIRGMRLVNAMLNGHLQVNVEKKVLCEHYFMTDSGFASYASDSHGDGGGEHSEDVETPFVTVLHLEGPLTREGGACTYGSREIRDLIMSAADRDECLGHMLIINGPGGVANTIPDFMQAIDYAHSKGQPVVGRIDGYCASAHIWVSAMCDEVYYNNPQDRIGSVGIYWAGITNKDGDTDPDTGGTWHIVYDPESYDKNKFYRDLADNNDDTLIKEELIHDGEVFRNYVKSRRPNATDEHLHGKMFDAKDVEGILVNGQATMQEVFERIVALHGKIGEDNANNSSTNNNTNMANIKEQFPALFAALQVEEMQMTDEGTFMNTELMARLNDALAEKKAEEPEAPATEPAAEPAQEPAQEPAAGEGAQEPAAEPAAEPAQEPAQEPTGEGAKEPAAEPAAEPAQEPANEEAVQAATEELDKIQETLHNAEQMIADKDKEIAELKESLDGQKNTAEQLQADIDQARKDIEAANGTIAERDATIAGLQETVDKLTKQVGDLKAEIKEMAGKPAPMIDAKSGIPADNCTGDAPETGAIGSAINDSMTLEEKRAAIRRQDAELKARREKSMR